MKRFFIAVLFCLMIGSLISACATTTDDKRGYGGKKSMPKPAREEIIPGDETSQAAPTPADEAVSPRNTPPESK